MFEGRRLKEQRKLLGISQETLAEKIDAHVNTIRRWEQGKQVPDVIDLEKLAEALQTTSAYLLGDSNDPQHATIDNNFTTPTPEAMNVKDNPSFIREGDLIGSGRVLMYEDKGKRYIFPATQENQAWFRELVISAILGNTAVQA